MRGFFITVFFFMPGIVQLSAQNTRSASESDQLLHEAPEIWYSSDTLLLNIVQSAPGDTLVLARHYDTPVRGVLISRQSVNALVTNYRIALPAFKNTYLTLSYRKEQPKGKVFLGRILQSAAEVMYQLVYSEPDGYVFRRIQKNELITH